MGDQSVISFSGLEFQTAGKHVGRHVDLGYRHTGTIVGYTTDVEVEWWLLEFDNHPAGQRYAALSAQVVATVIEDAWQKVQHRILCFTDLYPDAEWSWAHIVLSDLNLEDGWIKSCLEDYDKLEVKTEQDDATAQFLNELLTIPEIDRCPERG